MIVADTSVWIDYFNGTASDETDALDLALEGGSVAISDIILLEILQGFRSDEDYQMARNKLSILELYEMLGRSMVTKCADNYRFLRKESPSEKQTTLSLLRSVLRTNSLYFFPIGISFLL